MTALLELTVYFTVWTLITVVVGAAIRNQEWTKEGRDIGLGNRDNLKEATPMGGRAERAAKNSIEAAVFFVPLALIANAAGMDAEVMLGAQIAFWARIAYVPIYIAGVKYLRSFVWIVGVVGQLQFDVLASRIQQKYARIVTHFSISGGADCTTGDFNCMARELDRFCLDYANTESLSWHHCVSASLWMIGTAKPEL